LIDAGDDLSDSAASSAAAGTATFPADIRAAPKSLGFSAEAARRGFKPKVGSS
jgi:hypothetical protein